MNSCLAMSKESKTDLDNELAQMVGDTGTKVPRLGVIAFKDGKEIYSSFQGSAIIDSQTPQKNHPFTRKSRFRVASVSKMFTVFTIMQLVEQGKLNLDDDVSKYLGFTLRNPHYPNMPITVRMLASHQSSLRDGKIYSIPPQMGLQEFFRKDGFVYIMNGEAIEEDEDARSAGKFSNNYIWEETLGDAICRNVFVR